MITLDYSDENLAFSLSNKYTSPEIVASKSHFQYLKKYLGTGGLCAKTIFIEEEYISKDYLHDYVSYYALCFQNYSKICKRVHFVKASITSEKLIELLAGQVKDNKDFWDNYLGFIVVKPIPITTIGYTVLKTYSNGSKFNTRNFWGLRNYKVHIFGNELEINSLAFQEQDSVLAACATTAIWTMLNKASTDFHTILKSPSQITKDADDISSDGGRLFPNKGLNVIQICHAIENSGLVSEIKQPDSAITNESGETIGAAISNTYLKKILNAYSPIGIPIILVIQVPTGGQHGLHAIVASGYNQTAPTHIPPTKDITFLSENIEKFYAHDDQWGPFARIEFNNQIDLTTPWTDNDANKTPTYLKNIIVPLYPKIRISYEDIEIIVLGLDAIITFFFKETIVADLIWDIKIQFSEDFKQSVKHSQLTLDEKLVHIGECLPKYLWVATCYISDHKILEFTFDATDVSNGMIGNDAINHLPVEIKKTLWEFLKNNEDSLNTLVHQAKADYYSFFTEKLAPTEDK